jgi:hypothetical protein
MGGRRSGDRASGAGRGGPTPKSNHSAGVAEKFLPLRGFFLAPGQSAEDPDRDAEHHDHKDDLGDQKEEACGDPDEREEEDQQDFPQQDGDHTRGGYAENRLQNGQAPLEAATLRHFLAKSVTTARFAF